MSHTYNIGHTSTNFKTQRNYRIIVNVVDNVIINGDIFVLHPTSLNKSWHSLFTNTVLFNDESHITIH